ncbi:BET1L isoform 3 [Pan troglodytes]|uniref:BET1L isoform 3 n=1 Tax=Pan troglodytes TaxID=9598 RepID=A0A2J8JW59_PANTR|nr:BET1L isoform 3 [Pan troglodytes]
MADWARAQSPGAVEEILDRENKRMADSLASKVTRLKSLALDIDRDAEDQNRYLDGMVRAHGVRESVPCPSTTCCRACSVSFSTGAGGWSNHHFCVILLGFLP